MLEQNIQKLPHTTHHRIIKNMALIITLIFSFVLVMTGCRSDNQINDVITQKVSDPNRTQISVLVKYAFAIDGFEKVVEDLFPDIDLVQIGNYTRDMGINEYHSRLEHDDLTDIVMTWPLDVGKEYWKDRLIDLSGMKFTSKYNLSMLNKISTDGKLYYLPGPAQIRGIVYNKTLFEENGWEVPSDFEGFITLCKDIEASGIRSLQLGFGNGEVLDTALMGYSYGNCFSSPEDVQWLTDYNNGIGSFGEKMSPALDVFQRMVDEGIWQPEDLDIYYSDRERMLFSRQCAMVEDSMLLVYMADSLMGSTDEYALMPFFTPETDTSDWARLYMVCYIGLNKHLEEPQNKKKYEKILQLMDFISTAEGQSALSSDTGAMFSSLKDVSPPDVSAIKELVPALSKGRYAIFPQFKNVSSALRKGLGGMIRGEMDTTQVIEMVDAQNRLSINADTPTVIGSAVGNFTILETGNFVTDALRDFSGCEIALFMDNGKDGRYNGKGISASFYPGDVTDVDINRILPDLKHEETGTLWNVTVTGQNLINILEYSIPVYNNSTGWFYYFSGLSMDYSPTANPGQRVKKILTSGGHAIDPSKLYTVAVMDEIIPAEYIVDCEKTNVTIYSILEEYIKKNTPIAPSNDGRFTIIE